MQPENTRRAKGRQIGFTLLELLVVMAIMVLVMGTAAAAWLGIARGAALRGAVSNLHRVLSLARQHAMTYGTMTYVFFRQDDENGQNARYWVCAASGRHYGTNGVLVLNAGYARWTPDTLKGGTLYNLTDESWGRVRNNDEKRVVLDEEGLRNGRRNCWNAGDFFGWAIHERQYLPPTLMFYNTDNPSANNAPGRIVFFPDGTTEGAGSSDYVIRIKEKLGSSHAEITVRALTGLVEVAD